MSLFTTTPLPSFGAPDRRASLGAANVPTSVNLGSPGARDEVRAYGARLLDAYRDFRLQDLEPFFLGPLTPDGFEQYAKLMAPISVSAADHAKVRAERERQKIAALSRSKERVAAEMKLTATEEENERKLEQYLSDISGFNPLGPSPLQAWRALQGYEDELDRERKRAIEILGKPLESSKPNLGEPTALETLGTIGKWVLVIVGVGVAAWFFLPMIKGALAPAAASAGAALRGRRLPAEPPTPELAPAGASAGYDSW